MGDARLKHGNMDQAYNPLYLIRNNKVIETKGDRMAICYNSQKKGNDDQIADILISRFKNLIVYKIPNSFLFLKKNAILTNPFINDH